MKLALKNWFKTGQWYKSKYLPTWVYAKKVYPDSRGVIRAIDMLELSGTEMYYTSHFGKDSKTGEDQLFFLVKSDYKPVDGPPVNTIQKYKGIKRIFGEEIGIG